MRVTTFTSEIEECFDEALRTLGRGTDSASEFSRLKPTKHGFEGRLSTPEAT